MPDEAPLDQWPTGLVPESPGWFVVNVRDVAWAEHPQQGYATLFENPRGEPMPELEVRVRAAPAGVGLLPRPLPVVLIRPPAPNRA